MDDSIAIRPIGLHEDDRCGPVASLASLTEFQSGRGVWSYVSGLPGAFEIWILVP